MFGISIFLAVSVVMETVVNSENSCQPFAVKTENLNKRLVGHLLYEMKVPALFPCMNECVFLGTCKSINFLRSEQKCELNKNSKDANSSDIFEDTGSIFVDKTEFPQGTASPCLNHTCTDIQRCIPLENTFVCETLECGKLPEVENGAFQKGGKIAGTVRQFKCPDGLTYDGARNLTCLHNQTWSYFKTACRYEYEFQKIYPELADFRKFDLYVDGIIVEDRTSITFQVKGTSEADVLLQHRRYVFDDSVIEVGIGKYANIAYMIIVTQGDKIREGLRGNDFPPILSPSAYRWFWISWDQGCVKVGHGNSVGLNLGYSWCDLQFNITGISIGFSYSGEGIFLFYYSLSFVALTTCIMNPKLRRINKRISLALFAMFVLFLNIKSGQIKSQLYNQGTETNSILVKMENSRVYIYSAVAVFWQGSFEAAEGAKLHQMFNAIAISAFKIITENLSPFWCCYMLHNGTILSRNSSVNFTHPVTAIRVGVLFMCPLRHWNFKFRGVSLTFKNNTCPTDEHFYKKIIRPKRYFRKDPTEKTIAVCAKLSYADLDAGRLIEWLESLRLLGVDKVYSHVHELNTEAQKVFKYYERLGFTETEEFDLPEKDLLSVIDIDKRQGWNDEQVALYDCQSKLIMYDYVVVLDTDEFLVPNTNNFENGWRRLFSETFYKHSISSVFFWTALHITKWEPTHPDHQLYIGKYNNCTVPMIDREKFVYMPTKIQLGSVTTHKNKAFSRYKKSEASPTKAVVHHYRSCRPEWLESRSLNDKRENWLERRNSNRMREMNDTYFFHMKNEKYCYDFRRFTSETMQRLSDAIKEKVRRVKKKIL